CHPDLSEGRHGAAAFLLAWPPERAELVEQAHDGDAERVGREVPVDRGALRYVADAKPALPDVGAEQVDLAGVGSHQAQRGLEERALACPVRPYERGHGACWHPQRYALESLHLTVIDAESRRGKGQAAGVGSVRRLPLACHGPHSSARAKNRSVSPSGYQLASHSEAEAGNPATVPPRSGVMTATSCTSMPT